MFPFPRPKLIASVTVGERGQIVIPREIRTELKINPGTKLLVFSLQNDAIMVTRPEAFEEQAKKMQQHFADMLSYQSEIKEVNE
jgi:AbrB family looped-hinge helix DNA binding protein